MAEYAGGVLFGGAGRMAALVREGSAKRSRAKVASLEAKGYQTGRHAKENASALERELDHLTLLVGEGHACDQRPLQTGGARGVPARVALKLTGAQVWGPTQTDGC